MYFNKEKKMAINPIYAEFKGCTNLKGAKSTTNYPEIFRGEKEMLLNVYNEYMKPYRGGRRVSTPLDYDPSAISFVMYLENRLRDLGALPDYRIYPNAKY